MQACLGVDAVAVKIVVAEYVEPSLAFTASAVGVHGQAKSACKGDAEEVGGEAVVGLGSWGGEEVGLAPGGE